MQTTRRTSSIAQPAHLQAPVPGCASEPGWCMPVSNSTTPSPAATAQALQCGTPGHGSGRRRRKTPGRTRSPRPSSGLLDDLRSVDFRSVDLCAVDRGSVASAIGRETRLSPVRSTAKGSSKMAEQESASEAATKVQEVAANVRQAASSRRRSVGRRGRGGDAAVLRGDRRARRGRRRRDVGAGRARGRARPGTVHRPRGVARVHRRA